MVISYWTKGKELINYFLVPYHKDPWMIPELI